MRCRSDVQGAHLSPWRQLSNWRDTLAFSAVSLRRSGDRSLGSAAVRTGASVSRARGRRKALWSTFPTGRPATRVRTPIAAWLSIGLPHGCRHVFHANRSCPAGNRRVFSLELPAFAIVRNRREIDRFAPGPADDNRIHRKGRLVQRDVRTTAATSVGGSFRSKAPNCRRFRCHLQLIAELPRQHREMPERLLPSPSVRGPPLRCAIHSDVPRREQKNKRQEEIRT